MKVVIAGASSGIGFHLAKRFEKAGHRVWGLARSGTSVRSGISWRMSACDVADWEQVAGEAAEIKGDPAFGQVDALIICAALQGPIGPTVTLGPQEWSATVRINLDGTFHLIRAFFELLRGAERGRGKILCFSGGGATKPRPNFSAYAASKAGVVRLVENLAEEWRGLPMDINAIAPGPIATRMTEEVMRLGPTAAGENEVTAARRTLVQGDVGFARLDALVDFLLSEASDGISGKLISAPWDAWDDFGSRIEELAGSNLFTLRRITDADATHQTGKT